MSVLVIGGNGQLGRHLREELPNAEFWDRSVVDLLDLAALKAKLDGATVSAIVIAAAYTAVDKAESDRDLAWRINAEVPGLIANAAARLDVPLVHISTDYVFDGVKAEGYVESDPTGPLNEYGRSKLGGEHAVARSCHKHWILRTSWVFSEHGNNFPKTMLRLACDRDQLRVVHDQRGRPTYAGDLAWTIHSLLQGTKADPALPWGLHHVGGGPTLSWKDFAETVVHRAAARGLLGRVPDIVGIPTSDYPTPAARPRNSVLLTQPQHAEFVNRAFDWSRGLDRLLERVAATK